ncbi:MAG: glycosyltransferase family 4 protein [Alphaproteobacteria bacterium]|nr:glycosyltransferase family 4 protein [Alphaproteobacteria bacterium]
MSFEGEAPPFRVLQVMSGAGVGGIETFFFDAIEALRKAGLRQYVVIRPNVPFRQIVRLRDLGITVATAGFRPLWPWPTLRTLERAHQDFRPDLAQYWTGRAAHFARRRPSCANIGWFGGYRQMKDFRACDNFIAITPDLERHLREGGVDDAHMARVHTFSTLNDRPAAPVSRALFDTPENVPLLLVLARLHPKKGIDTLLHALAEVEGAYLWIAGEGPNRREYEELAHALGLGARVRFLGWQEDRAGLLAACDICVMPSRFEPFGTVMAEAWSSRRPLIVAAAQGPKAYVRDGDNGLMVPIDNPRALAAAIRLILNAPDLARRLVEGGTRSFESQFTAQAYVNGTLAFYQRVHARSQKVGS